MTSSAQAIHRYRVLHSKLSLNSNSNGSLSPGRRQEQSFHAILSTKSSPRGARNFSRNTQPISSPKIGCAGVRGPKKLTTSKVPSPIEPGSHQTVSSSTRGSSLDITSQHVPRSQQDTMVQMRTASVSSSPNNQYTHPFFGLPEAIRVKIFKYLTHTERLLAEFVCRRFRNDIRLRVGLRTKITEETSAGLTFLRDVLVVSIIIGKYERPVSAPSKLIYTCENIQELIFEEPICVQHLDAFLNRCRRIKWLIIRAVVHDLVAFPTAARGPSSNEWRTLELIHKNPVPLQQLKELILCIPNQNCLRTVNRTMTLLNTPSLERFSLMIKQPIAFDETTAVHFAVLNYLKNCLNLSHVIICTEQRPSTLRYTRRSGSVQLLERELNQHVESLHLKSLVLTEPAVAFETWNIVLNNQNSLEIFQVLHMTIWPLLRDIIIINAKTLVKVAVHVILWDKYGKHNPLDLNVFSRSLNLKELYICIAPPAMDNNASKDKDKANLPDMVNFHKLPKHLEVLALKHCHVNVKEFLGVRCLNFLKSLGIVSLGHSESNTIGVKALRKLLRIRSLDELFISGLIADVGDAQALKGITDNLKVRAKDKRRDKNTFHCHGESVQRWTVNRNGSAIFTIFSSWGFMSY